MLYKVYSIACSMLYSGMYKLTSVSSPLGFFLDTLWHCAKLKIWGVSPEVRSDEAEDVARCFVSAAVSVEMLLCCADGMANDQSTWMFERSSCKPNAEGAFSILAKGQEVDGCATQMVERVCVCACACACPVICCVLWPGRRAAWWPRAVHHSVMKGQVEAGANLRAYLLGGFEFAAFTL